MDPKVLLHERTELFDNAFNHKHNKRVPLGCNLWSWMVLDCGYTQSAALDNYEILEKVNREIHERYQFDAYHNLLVRNAKQVCDPLGGGCSWIDETDEFIQCVDINFLKTDEYREFLDTPSEFYWTKALPRYTKWNDPDFALTLGGLKKATQEFQAYLDYSKRMLDMNINDYGAMMYYSKNVQPAIEDFMVFLRGIRGVAIDARRMKDQFVEALDIVWERKYAPVLKAAMETEDQPGFISAVSCPVLAHSALNTKQFEELYWRHLKLIIDAAVLNNKKVYLFCEAEILRFAEFFQDVPKGVLMMHLEQDDIFEVRKQLPNVALAGGMPTELLGRGTKEACVDYTKKLIDGVGDGFVLCQNKMISYRNDCTRENLQAVCDTARNY